MRDEKSDTFGGAGHGRRERARVLGDRNSGDCLAHVKAVDADAERGENQHSHTDDKMAGNHGAAPNWSGLAAMAVATAPVMSSWYSPAVSWEMSQPCPAISTPC